MPPILLAGRRLVAGLALALTVSPALAADFNGPYAPPREPEPAYEQARPYPPPPPPVPEYHRPRFSAGPEYAPPPDGPCRVFVKRRFDPDGEMVVRRVRVCDERPGFGPRFGHRHGDIGFDGPSPERGPGWGWRGPGW